MPYTILEHTADVRLLVEGPTLAELFREALRGMMELMKPEGVQPAPNLRGDAPLKEGARGAGQTAESRRSICIESPSATALLVDFLNEALCLAHSHREMYEVAGIEVDREVAAAEGKGSQPEVAAPLEPGAQPAPKLREAAPLEPGAQPRVAVLLNAGARVRAELAGRAVDGFGEDIKAVTYNEAEIRRNAAGNLETMLVFDI